MGQLGHGGCLPDMGAQGKLPMALGPCPLWDTDEVQPETESADAEVEVISRIKDAGLASELSDSRWAARSQRCQSL